MPSRAAIHKGAILDLIRENPFVTQQEIAGKLGISRSAVANYISALMDEGAIVGRAYVLPQPKRIVCIGGANMDRKLQTLAPIIHGTSNPAFAMETHGGVARNIAENLGKMGAAPALCTVVGKDREGVALVEHATRCSVDVTGVHTLEGRRTGTYTAVLDHRGDLVLALADMHINDEFTVELLQRAWLSIASAEIVVADTNLPVATIHDLIQRAREEKLRLCVVPVSTPKAVRLPASLAGVYLLICNRDEAEAISGFSIENDAQLLMACRRLIDMGCENVLVTRGDRGVSWASQFGNWRTFAAEPTQVFDVTGAGDAFAAGVLYGLSFAAHDMVTACMLGQKLAALTLGTKETVSPDLSPHLVEQWLAE